MCVNSAPGSMIFSRANQDCCVTTLLCQIQFNRPAFCDAEGKPAVTWRTIRTPRLVGVTGVILIPVSRSQPGRMRAPGLYNEENDDELPAVPSATIPPVNVTFGQAMIFAGSDRPDQVSYIVTIAALKSSCNWVIYAHNYLVLASRPATARAGYCWGGAPRWPPIRPCKRGNALWSTTLSASQARQRSKENAGRWPGVSYVFSRA
jgi:hypothetical protein